MRMINFLLAASMIIGVTNCGSQNPPEKHAIFDLKGINSPFLGMTLGRGFDPTRPLTPRGDCLINVEEATITTWKDSRGIRGRFSETRIHTVKELFRELSLNSSFAAESLWGSGGASFSKYEKFKNDENSFTWMVDYIVDMGDKTLVGHKLRLSKKAQQLVDSDKLEEFYEMCGTEYIRSVKLGGRFTSVFEIESKYTELVQRISSSFKASANFGSWGFSGSANFSSFLKDAFFKSALKKEVSQLGGSKIDIDKIQPEKLGNYLVRLQEEMHSGRAIPIQVETASWSTLGVSGLNDFAKWHRKQTISRLYREYRHNLSLLSKIDDHFFWYENDVFDFTESSLQLLRKKKEKIEVQQLIISDLASQCIEDGKCSTVGLDRVVVNFPQKHDKIIAQSIGDFWFQIPKSYSIYGKKNDLGSIYGLTYAFPRILHGLSQVSDFRLVVYEKDCRSQTMLINKMVTKLRKQRLNVMFRNGKSAQGVEYTSLFWSRNTQLNELMLVFAKNRTGQCPVAKVTMVGSNLSFDDLLEEKAIRSMLESARF